MVTLLLAVLPMPSLATPLESDLTRTPGASVRSHLTQGTTLRAEALVLVNSASAGYPDFQHFIQPYLDHFGVPYTVRDIATTALGADVQDYALLVVGHRQLDPSDAYLDTAEEGYISAAVNAGTGMVNFDNDLANPGLTPRYQFVQDVFGFGYITPLTGAGVTFGSATHYIIERHTAAETITTGAMTLAGITLPSAVTALATTGTQPFLAVTSSGAGRAVQWGAYDWMSHAVKGPMFGLDDLVWRSLVWAARKPFVMQGLPPLVTMRMDDVSGPLDWIHVANEFGIKPWAGLFTDDIDSAEAADLANLVNTGQATVGLHAFSTDNFFYFDHATGANWSDAIMAANYATGTQWFAAHGIPSSKYVAPHSYEIGSNAFSGLDAWGVQFVGTHMAPGSPEAGSPWLQERPYRLYETGLARALDVPVAYADFLSVPGHSEFNNRFFNCVTEIRDEQGYDWIPSNEVASSVYHGTRQLQRALDGQALPTLFAHAYNVTGISNDNWRAILQGITTIIAPYQPIYVTLDYACQYLRAMHSSNISASVYDPATQEVNTTLSGSTDMATQFYLFAEEGGQIRQLPVDVPAFSGSTQVLYHVPGTLDHIVVSPASATLVTGSTQQFTAQGFDADNYLVPGLAFTWDVINGGGAITSAGLFTAGTTPGSYPNTVCATVGALQACASVAITPPPDEGPGGPILVVASAANPFTRYYAEILRTEGLNAYKVTDISAVDAAVLANYDVVILGEMALTAAQVTLFSDWVTAGGNLIAMRPDKQLAALLGLTDANATLANAYLLVNTSASPGAGIVGQTIQFHGAADRFTLSGATAVATLYATAAAPTANPAVTLHSVGANGGQAAAFTYDLARSIVYTRQGNPAWSGQERDGYPPIRSDDLFWGAAASDPQPDWIDLAKVAIPQADEQQRLLANLILHMNADRKPLPRFWYFPRGEKAVVIMTSDDHTGVGTSGRFDDYIALSPTGCSVADWACIRSSSYLDINHPLTDDQADSYTNLGFEVGLHVNTNCVDWTPATLEAAYTSDLTTWQIEYPSVATPVSERTHCVVWSDYATQPKVQLSHGIRLDTNYYFWPPAWVADRPGFFTGSALPMRFADLDGTLIDVYQAVTQMTDESGQSYPFTIDTLLDRALGVEGYYGAFTANMHADEITSSSSDAIIISAQARGVPVVSGRQMLQWLDGRNASSFGSLGWSGGALSFTVVAGTDANGLRAMLPMASNTGMLTTITRNGVSIAFTTATIKGVAYAIFPANAGAYVATYAVDITPPTISDVTAAPNASTAVIGWTTDEPADSRVDYGTAADALNLTVSAAAFSTAHSLALAGLTPDTTYYYRVTSQDAALNAATVPPTGDPLSFTTTAPDTTPPAISNVAAAPSFGTAVISWTTDEPADSLVSYGIAPDALTLSATAAALVTAHSLTLSGLTPDTIYYYRVTSQDAANNAATMPPTGDPPNFTTLACPCSIWPTSAAPTNPALSDGRPIEVGVKFRTEVNGYITGLRFYKGAANTGTHVGHLWQADGTPLAAATFTDETASGWQVVTLPTPIPVLANTTYTASYYSNSGYFAFDAGYFATTGVDNPPLHALASGVDGPNGVYRYDTSGFPTEGSINNYWVDVVFDTATVDTTPPTIANVVAAPTDETAVITWSTNEPADSLVSYGIAPDALTLSVSAAALVTAHNLTLSGLTPDTIYYYRVSSQDAALNTATVPPTGDPLGFTTTAPDITPPAISNVAAAPSFGTAVIGWTTDEPADSLVSYGIAPDALTLSATAAALVTAHSLTLSGLTPDTIYYYRVTSVDTTNNAATMPPTGDPLSFTTRACPCTIWPTSAAPANPPASDGTPIEVGVKFRTDTTGYVTGLRFYKGDGNTGTHVGHLWQADGTPLAAATFTGETASGWQEVTLAEPIPMLANTTYIASYHSSDGYFSLTNDGLATGVDNPPLHALASGVDGPNGVYLYGPSGFPTSGSDYNYWVDVVFNTTAVDTTPPTISDVAAAAASDTATITWTTNEAADSLVSYGIAPDALNLSATAGALVTAHSLTLSGLTPDTTYYYRVTSQDAADNAATAPPTADPPASFTATAVDTTPPVISDVAAAPGVNTANITWSTDEPADSRIDYGTAANALTLSATGAALVTAHSLTLAGLTPDTTYYYRVTSQDAADNAATAPPTADPPASFSTVEPTCPCTIWPSSATPANPAISDARPIEVGVKFRTDVAGYILGLRFYKGADNTGTHVGHLWQADGTPLAEATFTGETASGWQEVTLPAPIPVQAHTTYIASYYSPSGYFAFDAGYFATAGIDNPPLHALVSGLDGPNGVFRYDTSGFPTAGTTNNHWVDVVFHTTAQNEYTLTLVSAHGTVAKDPDQTTYHYGDTVQLTATAATGWTFANWTGDATGTTNPLNVLIDGNKTVTANYTQIEYTLSILSAHGTVTKVPDQATYHYGDVVQLTATADPGWTFAIWTGDATGTANPLNVLIDGNKTVTANYTQIEYTLTLVSAHGTVAKDPDRATYHYGDTVQLTATADPGWTFANWTGDVTDTANPLNVLIDGNKTVTANYTQNEYTLTVTVVGSGAVAKGPDQATYHYGETVTLAPVPAAGWAFIGWSGLNAADLSDNGDGTWSLVINGDKALTATFSLQRALVLTIVGSGMVTRNPAKTTYNDGETVTLTPVPTAGWAFTGWSGLDAADLSDNGDGTWSLVMNGDKALTATFIQQRTLTLTIVGSGVVTRSPNKTTYNDGETVTLTPVPAAGWAFTGWSGLNAADLSDNGDGTWSLVMNGDKTLTATFLKQHTLTLTIVGSGVVTRSPAKTTYNHNEIVTLTPVPAATGAFIGWSGSDAKNLIENGDGTWSLRMNSDKVLTATFTVVPPIAPVISIEYAAPGVVLKWQHLTANTSYEVWRSATPYFNPVQGELPLAIVPAPMTGFTVTYPDTTAVSGDFFYYIVRGVNASSQVSEASNRVGIFRFPLIPGS